jgi:hypothetical protein
MSRKGKHLLSKTRSLALKLFIFRKHNADKRREKLVHSRFKGMKKNKGLENIGVEVRVLGYAITNVTGLYCAATQRTK